MSKGNMVLAKQLIKEDKLTNKEIHERTGVSIGTISSYRTRWKRDKTLPGEHVPRTPINTKKAQEESPINMDYLQSLIEDKPLKIDFNSKKQDDTITLGKDDPYTTLEEYEQLIEVKDETIQALMTENDRLNNKLERFGKKTLTHGISQTQYNIVLAERDLYKEQLDKLLEEFKPMLQ